MVNFKNRLGGRSAGRPQDPIDLYGKLDRASDKGPLRPAQEAVLKGWTAQFAKKKDVIIKLHTGQGKTLIGLLILQSKLNGRSGPVAYLCPNNHLVAQTCEQARQFGIETCTAEPELPDEFLNGQKILVTSVQKLFNGRTRFGLYNSSVPVDTILMDDAHACVDSIRDACRIAIPSEDAAYHELKSLFRDDLEEQGVGTFADIDNGEREAILPVPYWAWQRRARDVAAVLSQHSQTKAVKYAWSLLKNMLSECQCVFSGAGLEIEPYVAPLEAFGSYWEASHRLFMSATVTDDAFLVKGLRLDADTIANPLMFEAETWSGEKMVIIPSLINDGLDRDLILRSFGKPQMDRKYGVVTLTPSFAKAEDWKTSGSLVASKETLETHIENLRVGNYQHTVVLANRYDGVDLPDNSCRVLILDSKPFSSHLTDLYEEMCRPRSDITFMRTVRTVEQGMGRSVRGEKDYSVILITGAELVRLVREKRSRAFLSSQMEAQIQIGLELADMARQEIEEGQQPWAAFVELLRQSLGRDEDWKSFYAEQMESVAPKGANIGLLRLYEAELAAEEAFASSDYEKAMRIIQKALDDGLAAKDDKGWYLQMMARLLYPKDRIASEKLQVKAHKQNRMLLRPPSGVVVSTLAPVSHKRVERVNKWISDFDSYAEMNVSITDILSNLVFGIKADKFERALDELGRALGFATERPDKEWKEGPDNLWALDDGHYLLWECKNEVKLTRIEINKTESEQMNRSSAWFAKHYKNVDVRRIIIHPINAVASAASFTDEVEAMRVNELTAFKAACRSFFSAFESQDFASLSENKTQELLDSNGLSVEAIFSKYGKKLRDVKNV